MYEVMIEDEFCGAHHLVGYRGKCESVHGHNWKVAVVVRGEKLGKDGLLVDFHFLRKKLTRILEELDHKNLNTISFFRRNNPSSENLARYIFLALAKSFRKKSWSIYRVTVWENWRQSATYLQGGKNGGLPGAEDTGEKNIFRKGS